MTKKEAVEEFVQRRFAGIPTEWVNIVAQSHMQYHSFPMWGTMWFVDSYWGERLWDKHSAIIRECEDHFNISDGEKPECEACDRYNEEMYGERVILDKDGHRTAVYIYEIEGEYLIGIHGAGWDFYDGVWDMLYDVLGLCWHQEEILQPEPLYSLAA